MPGHPRIFFEAGTVDPVVVRGLNKFMDKTHLFEINAVSHLNVMEIYSRKIFLPIKYISYRPRIEIMSILGLKDGL
jgi:hypothetical protein